MRHELDSAEIIAFCLKQKQHSDKFEIAYSKIQAIGRRMEEKMPFLNVSSDMVSIDAFRCEFSSHVEMREEYLRINSVHEIYSRIERYLPDSLLEEKLKELELEER